MNLRIAKKIRKHAQHVARQNVLHGWAWEDSPLARYPWKKVTEACNIVGRANDRKQGKAEKPIRDGIKRVASFAPTANWTVRQAATIGRVVVLEDSVR